MLFSEPKIPQFHAKNPYRIATAVSVLFSEPKIPQCLKLQLSFASCRRFSALQRAENSSMVTCHKHLAARLRFQCSSASRKFLNFPVVHHFTPPLEGFSALQRAENSSIVFHKRSPIDEKTFQCSSASRKFLNRPQNDADSDDNHVSVLFSEPKIPQCKFKFARFSFSSVSVLFSEPKIPQSW